MTTLTFRELGRAAWKRRWWFVIPVLLGIAGALVAVRMLPKVYRASTLVMVEPQKVPADYIKATVTTTLGDRLKTIEQQITNRSNMERIIDEMNLYPELRGQSEDDMVDKARSDLTLQVKGDSVFRILFSGRDPEKIAAAANRIAELFIQENLRLRARQAQGTTKFLEGELAETKQRLEIQEARIAQFKQSYMGALPEQRDTNLRGVEQLQSKLQINLDALDKAEQRKILAQRELASWRPDQPVMMMPAAPRGPSSLEVARTELADLLSRYTDRHPDVVRKREQIALLERQAEAIEESPAEPLPPRAAPAPVNPLLRAQLDSIDIEIRGLQAENTRILAQIGDYQGRLAIVPRVEQQLLSLTRDYDNIRASYESLLAKRIDANLAENLEQTRQSEQFTILEKALPPTQPVEPNQLLLLAAGILGGALLGAVLALLREQTDPTYGDAEHFREAFPAVSVLATIPRLGGNAGRAPAVPARRAAAGGRR